MPLLKNDITLQHITKAKQHNEVALAFIIGKMMPTIQFYSKRVAQPAFELDDAMQEALIGLFNAIETYEPNPDALFTTYANRCIRNAVISGLRKATQKKQTILNQSIPLTDNESAISLEEQVLLNEQLDQTMDNVKKRLSPFEQTVLFMSAAGFSYKEISIVLDKNIKSVENALVRARKKLK